MKATSPLIITPRNMWTAIERLKEWGGRKRGTTGGSLVGDMVHLEKTIVLCGFCQHKFDYKRHGYYSVWRYENTPVVGDCDVCKMRIAGTDGRLFLHENVRHKAWATPEEKRARLTTKRRTGSLR